MQCGEGQAAFAIQRIADLYAFHRRIETLVARLGSRWNKGDAQPDRVRIDAIIGNRRMKWMTPIVDDLEAWNSRMVQSATPKEKFGEAIGYFRNQSVRLRQFLTHAQEEGESGKCRICRLFEDGPVTWG